MTFLNPWLLLGSIGVAGAVLIHLLSRYRHRRLEWAAMELLRRAVRVRTRRLRLENILLLLLRCLIIILVALALARPTTKAFSALGKPDAGMVVALDGSMSMSHEQKGAGRFDRALDKARRIFETAQTGSPASIMLMGAKPRVKLRNGGYQKTRVDDILNGLDPLPEVLNLEGNLQRAGVLLDEIKSPNKELYLITDAQKTDWQNLSNRALAQLKSLAAKYRVFLVPVRNAEADNVAVTELQVTSGALRVGEIVRITARIKNCGSTPRGRTRLSLTGGGGISEQSIVTGLSPGDSTPVPFFIRLTKSGPVRLTASIEDNGLEGDNRRRTVINVKRRPRVLIADGDPFGSGHRGAADYISRALSPPGRRTPASLLVRAIPWLSLPSISLHNYDVVILANVPDIPEVTARGLRRFVRRGGGLIVFAGGNVRPNVLNKRMTRDGESLLPAKLLGVKRHTVGRSTGQQMNIRMTDHPIGRILASFPADTIAGSRFYQHMRVEMRPESKSILQLTGGVPLLVERRFGRGKVLLCTSSADRSWNNMALNPVFPTMLQGAVTELLRAPFEHPLTVGEETVMPVPGQAAGDSVSITTPRGQTWETKLTMRDGEIVLDLSGLEGPGFYDVDVGGKQTWPLAVNPDTAESQIQHCSPSELKDAVDGSGVQIVEERENVVSTIEQTRRGRELWKYLIAAALSALVIESIVAKRYVRRPETR